MLRQNNIPQKEPTDSSASNILYGVPIGAESLAINQLLAGSGEPVLYITHSDRDMDIIEQEIGFFIPDIQIIKIPAWDCLPYDRVSPQNSIMAERISALAELLWIKNENIDNNIIILTTASAVLQKTTPIELLQQANFRISKGESLDLPALEGFFASYGYRRAGKVMEKAEYAVRGNIIDIFPTNSEQAIRLDLFGDEVESISLFDTLSQISDVEIGEYVLYPASEVIFNDGTIDRFRSKYRELFGAAKRDDTLYHNVSNNVHYNGMEHWLPLFYENTNSIFDYLPAGCRIILTYHLMNSIADKTEMIADYYNSRMDYAGTGSGKSPLSQTIYNPLSPDELYFDSAQIEKIFEGKNAIEFSPLTPPSGDDNYHVLPIKSGKNIFQISKLHGGKSDVDITPISQLFVEIGKNSEEHKSTIICCNSLGSLDRIAKILGEMSDFKYRINKVSSFDELSNKRANNIIYIAVLPLTTGFETPTQVYYSEQDIFGHKIIQTRFKKKRASENFIAEAANFEIDDLLVHKEHGIGRFAGLVTIEADSNKHDCLKLVYAGADKLFIPVENIDLLTSFGAGNDNVKLDKLGSTNWQKRKEKLKEHVKLAAEELIKTAADRELARTDKLYSPVGLYEEFAAKFPYTETEDQERAISEVLSDLHSERPMDRLVCGDVGFGKTEVALRAAFVTATAEGDGGNAQVALICPTTLLARQHFKNFAQRFEDTGINVAMLSRLTTSKQAKLNHEGLQNGAVDIIIGTHSLLADKIKFKNLGLIIIDEEQHFGVKQKEKLKKLKDGVNVLTLTATPIPRTLQMSLSGVKELSLITTPPVDRLAIRSFVMPFDPMVLKEAITREIHRGGQVFYVTPRIADLAELKHQILDMMPHARLAIANGQLPPAELDQIMNDFYDGKYDILLSTSIIESGIDIPTANTIIINRPDKFGLAQLYQMRGRVGRGKVRAYAYFTIPNHHQLSKNALKRLEVMQTLDSLGAGFTLASHDMDIRGFGNLVGEEQSGHIKEVGVELYQHMLEEAVANAKAGVTADDGDGITVTENNDWSPQINLGLSVLIPDDYIDDLGLRLSLYRRISKLESEAEINSFAAEMVDRFGKLPKEVESLLKILHIKQICRRAYIERIDTGPKGAVISFYNNIFPNPDALIGLIAKNSLSMKLRPDQKLFCRVSFNSADDKIQQVEGLIQKISGLL